jgi:hypothetical protein
MARIALQLRGEWKVQLFKITSSTSIRIEVWSNLPVEFSLDDMMCKCLVRSLLRSSH